MSPPTFIYYFPVDATNKTSSIAPLASSIQQQVSVQEDGSTVSTTATTNGDIGNGSNHAPPLQVSFTIRRLLIEEKIYKKLNNLICILANTTKFQRQYWFFRYRQF